MRELTAKKTRHPAGSWKFGRNKVNSTVVTLSVLVVVYLHRKQSLHGFSFQSAFFASRVLGPESCEAYVGRAFATLGALYFISINFS